MISELWQRSITSKSPIDGFAALQVYSKTNRIQTVISDSGVGIANSLRLVLKERYPELYEEFKTTLK
ncbi:hypothetical protein O9929_28255 [Vibrio lentus]|nr:hypothetical protein [Vibrio lentus]